MPFIICGVVVIVFCFLTYQLLLRPKLKRIWEYNLDIERLNNKLIEENEKLVQEKNSLVWDKEHIQSEILFLKSQRDDVQNSIDLLKSQAQQSADIFYEQAMKIAEQRFDADLVIEETSFHDACYEAEKSYKEILEDYMNNFQEQIKEKEQKLTELDAVLADLKAKHNAVIEQAKRQEELESKIDYYRIQIPEEDKNEIEAILSIKHLISNKRNIYMLIWSSYYSKRVNELAVRVLGSNPICGIYRITNIQTQQAYVGQAKDIRERYRDHVKAGLGIDTPGQNKLYTNMLKYGVDNFTFELLEECPATELDAKEKYWIEFYDTYNNGLNSNRGNSNKKG